MQTSSTLIISMASNIMAELYEYASISRQFFKDNNVYRYRMKKIDDMTDKDVINYCHWYCEENNMVTEWNEYLERAGLE